MTVNDPDLLVGTMATYSCDQGYVLAGDTVRTCEERGDETEGTWNATQPTCEGENNRRGINKSMSVVYCTTMRPRKLLFIIETKNIFLNTRTVLI